MGSGFCHLENLTTSGEEAIPVSSAAGDVLFQSRDSVLDVKPPKPALSVWAAF